MTQASNRRLKAAAPRPGDAATRRAGIRLAPWEADTIRRATAAHFGAGVRVWLFGSRADPSRRGGDIDLYLEPAANQPDTLERELRLYAALQLALGEQRIDLVVRRYGSPELAIHREAKQTGAEL
jgi:predicted nucleotidyltransferase